MRFSFLTLAASTSRVVSDAALRTKPLAPPPPPGAAKLVRQLLLQHGRLNTQEIFKLGTENAPRPELPKEVVDSEGKVLMKRRSNVRGGKSPLVPMPTAPFPDHPFVSTNHLKTKVLATLESSGLIHLSKKLVPHRNDEERTAALELAARMNIRRERKAKEQRLPPPEPLQARETTAVWAWELGPAPAEETQYRHTGWDEIDHYEVNAAKAREQELKRIEERRTSRRISHREERQRTKEEKELDRQAGRLDEIKKEKERDRARRGVEQYAALTGNDVAGWFGDVKLGKDELPEPAQPLLEEDGFSDAVEIPRRESKPRRTDSFGLEAGTGATSSSQRKGFGLK